MDVKMVKVKDKEVSLALAEEVKKGSSRPAPSEVHEDESHVANGTRHREENKYDKEKMEA